MSDLLPWAMLDAESPQAFSSFVVYRDMGAGRLVEQWCFFVSFLLNYAVARYAQRDQIRRVVRVVRGGEASSRYLMMNVKRPSQFSLLYAAALTFVASVFTGGLARLVPVWTVIGLPSAFPVCCLFAAFVLNAAFPRTVFSFAHDELIGFSAEWASAVNAYCFAGRIGSGNVIAFFRTVLLMVLGRFECFESNAASGAYLSVSTSRFVAIRRTVKLFLCQVWLYGEWIAAIGTLKRNGHRNLLRDYTALKWGSLRSDKRSKRFMRSFLSPSHYSIQGAFS